MNYKPLPTGLFIKDSNIEGQGLFTTRDLIAGCELGESHYRIDTSGIESINEEENKNLFIRTPLGGFINHSEEPNCPNPDDHIEPRRSALFLARSVLGAYSDGRHQCLFDIITRGQKNQRYRRPFRCVMNLRWSWRNATQPLNRLTRNSACETVLRIAATHLTTPTDFRPP
jgi:hypothetical protein